MNNDLSYLKELIGRHWEKKKHRSSHAHLMMKKVLPCRLPRHLEMELIHLLLWETIDLKLPNLLTLGRLEWEGLTCWMKLTNRLIKIFRDRTQAKTISKSKIPSYSLLHRKSSLKLSMLVFRGHFYISLFFDYND